VIFRRSHSAGGLCSPRQDLWIGQHLPDLGVRIAMGVGGLFDFYSGAFTRSTVDAGTQPRVVLPPLPGAATHVARISSGNVVFLSRVIMSAIFHRSELIPSTRTLMKRGNK